MGTNFNDFICEANRVLKNKGILIVVEIESRINSVMFNKLFKNLGFDLRKEKPFKEGYFKLFIFRKYKNAKKISFKKKNKNEDEGNYYNSYGNNSNNVFDYKEVLQPCMYKKR